MKVPYRAIRTVSYVSTSCMLLGFCSGCYTTHGKYDDDLDETIKALTESRVHLAEINSTMQRMVGTMSPIIPQENAVRAIADIEQRVDKLQTGIITSRALIFLDGTYRTTVAGLPPIAQESVLHRLVALDWSLTNLKLFTDDPENKKATAGVIVNLQTQLDIQPESAPKWIGDRMRERLLTTKGAWLKQVINDAKTDNGAASEIELALANMELLPAERNMLLVELLSVQAKRLDSIPDYRLRQHGAENLYNTALGLRYAVAIDPAQAGSDMTALDNQIAGFERTIAEAIEHRQKEENLKIRRYQGWALAQLDAFRKDAFDVALKDIRDNFARFKAPTNDCQWRVIAEYPEFTKAIEKIAGVKVPESNILSVLDQKKIYKSVSAMVGWKSDKALAQLVVREAMIRYLLPVDDRFLDPVVGKYFNKVYNEALAVFEGTEDFMVVTKRTVDVVKKSPSDIEGL